MAKHDSGKEQGHDPEHNSGQGDSCEGHEAGSFGQQAKDVAAAVAQQTRSAVATATEKGQEALAAMQDRAQEAVAGVPGQMKHLAGQIRERGPQEGTLGNAAHTVANTLESSATYLEEHDVRAMAEDLATVIRKNPIPAVLASIGVGFLVGRTLRR